MCAHPAYITKLIYPGGSGLSDTNAHNCCCAYVLPRMICEVLCAYDVLHCPVGFLISASR